MVADYGEGFAVKDVNSTVNDDKIDDKVVELFWFWSQGIIMQLKKWS